MIVFVFFVFVISFCSFIPLLNPLFIERIVIFLYHFEVVPATAIYTFCALYMKTAPLQKCLFTMTRVIRNQV